MNSKSIMIALALVGIASTVACYDMHLQRRLQYDSIDDVAVDATGKPLWELAFGEREVNQVKQKLRKVKSDSLYCIQRNIDANVDPPQGLSAAQEHLRMNNVILLREQALAPELKMRESEGKRRVIMGGCQTRP